MGEHELRVDLVRFYPMYMLVFICFFGVKTIPLIIGFYREINIFRGNL